MQDNINDMDNEVPFCFLCDHPCCGAYFNLSNCVMDCTRTKISTKLADLVGEEFIVIIEENDVICRSCFNILNTMERLESQLRKLGSTIFNFLEDKYSLKTGEMFESAPPLQILFKKDPLNTVKDKENKKSKDTDAVKDGASKKPDETKALTCDQCNYSTPFRAFMVFHIREHRKLNNPPLTVNIEEVVEQPTPVPQKKTTKANKRGKTSGSVSKRVKTISEAVNSSTPLVQEVDSIQLDEIDSGGEYRFLHGQDEDHLSEEMLTKVDALVEASEQMNAVLLSEQNDVQISETTKDQVPESQTQLQVFLAENDLLEVVGQPGIFCMLDSNTGKIVQRLRKSDDGSFVPTDLMESESQTVMHQLEDGTFEVVSLPGLEDSGNGLTLM